MNEYKLIKTLVSVPVPYTAGQTWAVLQCLLPRPLPRPRYLDKTWSAMGCQEPYAHGKRGGCVAGGIGSPWCPFSAGVTVMLPLDSWRSGL